MKYKNCHSSFPSSLSSHSVLYSISLKRKNINQFERSTLISDSFHLLHLYITITMSTTTASMESAFQPLHQGSISNANTQVNTSSISSEEPAVARPNLPAHMLRRNLLSSYVQLLCLLFCMSMFTNPSPVKILLLQRITSCLLAVKNCKLTSTNTSPSKCWR